MRSPQYQEDGPDYIHAILNGYADPPAGFTLPPGAQYNKYFPGHAIGMPKPLSDGQVEYTDGTPTTVDQYGRDLAAFLMWAAEPTLDARKRLGFQVFPFLIVLTGLLYFTKKRVWHEVVHHPSRSSRARRRISARLMAGGRSERPPHHDVAAVTGEAGEKAVDQHQ